MSTRSKNISKQIRRKNPAAVALGKLGGRKGGKARAAKLSASERSASARRASLARWNSRKRSVSAVYEYGPFGELLRATGPMAKANPFRFSTKYEDDETDLLYYGHRYYNPSAGRWASGDPINELGFNLLIGSQARFNSDEEKNLYAFVHNDPMNLIDADGRVPFVLIFTLGNAIGNIGLACYDCTQLAKCLSASREMTKRAADRLDPEAFQDWLRAAKPGSECTAFAKSCGKRVITATFWVAGRILVLRYFAVN